MAVKLSNDEFIRRINELNKGYIIRGEYINSHTEIEMECALGHIWPASPSNLYHNKSGCPYCAGKKVWRGYNDLWTTRPDVAVLLKNPNDGYVYTKGSSKKVHFVCPDCGAVDEKCIDMVCRYGFACKSCSDGISYPNKFGRSLLKQLPISGHICEFSPEWASGRIYDNYFEYDSKLYILEMDGALHYEEISPSSLSLQDRQNIDKAKDIMAMEHGINIIRIDCKKSNCDYIKNNIINSELGSIFNLSCVDWGLCDFDAHKNLIKEVCELYNSGVNDLHDIKDLLNISMCTTRQYLQDGAKFGWCDYTVEKSRKLGMTKLHTPINLVDQEGNIIMRFEGITICIKEMRELYGATLNSPNIVKSCKTGKPYKGFRFQYV